MRTLPRRSVLATLPLALGGCGVWDSVFGDTKKPLPGERRAVLPGETELQPDEGMEAAEIALPPPVRNTEWPVPGGTASNVMGHLEAGERLSVAWRTSAGTGASQRRRLMAPPVVMDGRVFVADADARVAAFDLAAGRSIWRVSTRPEGASRNVLGAGVACDGPRVIVATGHAEALALAAETGEILWRRSLPSPSRGALTIVDNRAIILCVEGQVVAVDTASGEQAWQYRGPSETTTLLASPAPAAEQGLVLVGFGNGDIAALRLDSGRPAWSEVTGGGRGRPSIADLASVVGRPAIDRGRGFVTGTGGVTMALDMRSGRRIWERELAGRESPWIAGDWLFLVSAAEELACLSRNDGRARWVTPLPRFRDEDRRRDPIQWTGPVLIGDRLVVASTRGQAIAVSPYSGDILGRQGLPDGVRVSPVVADGTLLLLSDDATLVALR
ncbi:MAG: PQQ-binding-like beta-propeller repeat protein [Acetobacteraceae bacterium]|nr:PQQ-binding-like beta-propeller repeat protein [Acetobacteraceae bacterium]